MANLWITMGISSPNMWISVFNHRVEYKVYNRQVYKTRQFVQILTKTSPKWHKNTPNLAKMVRFGVFCCTNCTSGICGASTGCAGSLLERHSLRVYYKHYSSTGPLLIQPIS